MKKPAPIEISDLDHLLPLMMEFQFRVEWHVRCDIGPDWIGAGREIRFYLEQRPLAGNSFHQYLKDILVQALSIPDECPDAVINGYGTITRVLDVLEIEYEWSEAVPYMDPRESRFGKVEFCGI